MGVPRAAQALAPRTGQPQGLESEAYLNSTLQGSRPEDARKDGHIQGRSSRFMNIPGYNEGGSENASCGFQLQSEEEGKHGNDD